MDNYDVMTCEESLWILCVVVIYGCLLIIYNINKEHHS